MGWEEVEKEGMVREDGRVGLYCGWGRIMGGWEEMRHRKDEVRCECREREDRDHLLLCCMIRSGMRRGRKYGKGGGGEDIYRGKGG